MQHYSNTKVSRLARWVATEACLAATRWPRCLPTITLVLSSQAAPHPYWSSLTLRLSQKEKTGSASSFCCSMFWNGGSTLPTAISGKPMPCKGGGGDQRGRGKAEGRRGRRNCGWDGMGWDGNAGNASAAQQRQASTLKEAQLVSGQAHQDAVKASGDKCQAGLHHSLSKDLVLHLQAGRQ